MRSGRSKGFDVGRLLAAAAVCGAPALALTEGAGCSSDSYGTTGDGGGGGDGARSDGASGGDDASSDGAPGSGDGSSGPFCASLSPAPPVCIDFDQAQPSAFIKGIQSPLGGFRVPDGGDAGVDPGGRSPPNAMHVIAPAGPPTSTWVGIYQTIKADFTPNTMTPHAHLRFDYKLASGQTIYERRIADLIISHTNDPVELKATFFVREGGAQAGVDIDGWSADAEINFASANAPLPQYDKWTTVDLDLRVTGTQGTATITYDGATSPIATVSTNVTPDTAKTATFFIGLNSDPGEVTANADIDNVVLTTQ